MKTHKGSQKWLESYQGNCPKTVVTIGNFDGVHLGHQKLLQILKEKSSVYSAELIVCSFDPHPVQVLFPDKKLIRLFPFDDLSETLTKYGVHHLILEAFTRPLSKLSPQDYFSRYIAQPLKPSALVVGHDFSFGHNKSGNLELLNVLCLQAGIELCVVEAQKYKQDVVSSSSIRKKLTCGQVDIAKILLGRSFYVKETVVRGQARGKELGFPTINLIVANHIVPKMGVYMTLVELQSQLYPAVTNIGTAPTFNDQSSSQIIETHILNFNADLYGTIPAVHFIRRIRDEKKFASKNELVLQIELDISKTRDFFNL